MTLTKLDVSSTSVVVTCKECPHWWAFAWTREDAHERANTHERLVHGKTTKGASAARAMWKRRHAA